MSTERLYLADVTLKSFTAEVVRRGDWSGRPAVVLDRTAFYPEGGGQPADRGLLDHHPVLDVQIDEDGLIWHLMDGALDTSLKSVTGTIDWTRRSDHMQQHLGQHLLSAAFEELCRLPTLAFHLGRTEVTIDLPGPPLEPHTLRQVEARVNQVIAEARPVLARFVTPDELADLPLRKQPAVSGPIRIVSVPDYDHSPCGGTHPRTTGGVGGLVILGQERRGKEIRVSFLCGNRLVREARNATERLDLLARSLTVGVPELPEAIARLQEEVAAARREVEALEQETAQLEAERLTGDGPGIVVIDITPKTLGWGRILANAIVERASVAIVSTVAPNPQLLLACPEGGPDANALLKRTLGVHGGRGGGSRTLAQGGAPSIQALTEAARTLEQTVREAGHP